MVVVANVLGLKNRNPVGGWLSYLFTLLVIFKPSLKHFCLFIFVLHSGQVSREASLSSKRSDRTLNIFRTYTLSKYFSISLQCSVSRGNVVSRSVAFKKREHGIFSRIAICLMGTQKVFTEEEEKWS